MPFRASAALAASLALTSGAARAQPAAPAPTPDRRGAQLVVALPL